MLSWDIRRMGVLGGETELPDSIRDPAGVWGVRVRDFPSFMLWLTHSVIKTKRILANGYGVPAMVSPSLSVESQVNFITYAPSGHPYHPHTEAMCSFLKDSWELSGGAEAGALGSATPA